MTRPTRSIYYSVGVYHRTYGSNAFTGSDGSSLGLVNGKKASSSNISKGKFPVSRYLFNVYCAGDPSNSNKCGTDQGPAPSWVQAYMGEHGFLCKNDTAHKDSSNNPILDPVTGEAYRLPPGAKNTPVGELPDTISAQGFVPVPKQSDNTYCVTFTT